LALSHVTSAATPRQAAYRPGVVSNGAGIAGPGRPTPPPVTPVQASATCVTMVAKPSVLMAK
jgi:hypothetical protein